MTLSPFLEEAIKLRRQQLQYDSWLDYTRAALRLDFLDPRSHDLVHFMSELPPDEQDAIDAVLLERVKNGTLDTRLPCGMNLQEANKSVVKTTGCLCGRMGKTRAGEEIGGADHDTKMPET